MIYCKKQSFLHATKEAACGCWTTGISASYSSDYDSGWHWLLKGLSVSVYGDTWWFNTSPIHLSCVRYIFVVTLGFYLKYQEVLLTTERQAQKNTLHFTFNIVYYQYLSPMECLWSGLRSQIRKKKVSFLSFPKHQYRRDILKARYAKKLWYSICYHSCLHTCKHHIIFLHNHLLCWGICPNGKPMH